MADQEYMRKARIYAVLFFCYVMIGAFLMLVSKWLAMLWYMGIGALVVWIIYIKYRRGSRSKKGQDYFGL